MQRNEMAGDGTIPAGTRVEVRYTLLDAGERAPGIPDDTARLPYEVRVRGVLDEPAGRGERATVVTATGRRVAGVIEQVDPADTHTFGRPGPALAAAIQAIGELTRSLR